MKKKIAADLTSLAHRILQLKNKDDVTELQSIAKELYEKLTVLAFTEKHFANASPTAGSKEIEERLGKAYSEAQENVEEVSNQVEEAMESAHGEVEEAFANNDLSDLFVPAEEDEREEMDLPGISTINKMVIEMPDEVPETPHDENLFERKTTEPETSQEIEKNKEQKTSTLQQDIFSSGLNHETPNFERVDTKSHQPNNTELKSSETPKQEISKKPEKASWEKLIEKVQKENNTSRSDDNVDVSDITPKKEYIKNDFEEITADFKDTPVFERKVNDSSDRPKSLNERLNKGMKIGMNDRLGFVRHLFNGNTDDFNRVLSQLNTIPTSEKAHQFIDTMVKPEYNNWEGKDAHAEKFKELVERNYS